MLLLQHLPGTTTLDEPRPNPQPRAWVRVDGGVTPRPRRTPRASSLSERPANPKAHTPGRSSSRGDARAPTQTQRTTDTRANPKGGRGPKPYPDPNQSRLLNTALRPAGHSCSRASASGSVRRRGPRVFPQHKRSPTISPVNSCDAWRAGGHHARGRSVSASDDGGRRLEASKISESRRVSVP